MRELLEAIGIVVLCLFFVVLLIGVIHSLIALDSYLFCNQLEKVTTEQDLNWSFWTGCMIYVEEEGLWVKYSQYTKFLSVRGELDR